MKSASDVLRPLRANPDPSIDFSAVTTPRHLSAERLSWFPKAHGPDSTVLDIGCGKGRAREVCEHAGFNYVGVDYNVEKAPILADGHALPFADEVFQFALSIAVLEHVQYPFLFCAEVARVLEDGGTFLGSVSFHEPYHESFYHHSYLGVYNTLTYAGFNVSWIAHSKNQGVRSIDRMLFRDFPPAEEQTRKAMLDAYDAYWRTAVAASELADEELARRCASGFTFLATKPSSRAVNAEYSEKPADSSLMI